MFVEGTSYLLGTAHTTDGGFIPFLHHMVVDIE